LFPPDKREAGKGPTFILPDKRDVSEVHTLFPPDKREAANRPTFLPCYPPRACGPDKREAANGPTIRPPDKRDVSYIFDGY